MTTPLNGAGSDFPCKGYLSDASRHVTATYYTGQTYNVSLAGSATHGGGSCQLSISYDNGATFKVIESILGGCPLSSNYNFALPHGLPAAKGAIFSWSWFNKVGNREMYQNCALVDIIDASNTGSQSTLNALPNMQTANVGKGCNTVEGVEAIPFNPGQQVLYGGDYSAGSSAVANKAGLGFSGSCGSAASAQQPPTVGGVGGGAGNAGTTLTTTKLPTTSSTMTSSPTSTPPQGTLQASSGTCSAGSIACYSDGYTWALCSGGKYINMGKVAAGTKCVNGVIIADSGVQNPVPVAVTTSATTSPRAGRVFNTVPAAAPAPTTTATGGTPCKRESTRCKPFSLACSADGRSFRLCDDGLWTSEEHDVDDATEICLDGVVRGIAENSTSFAKLACSGTGITCHDSGRSYTICGSAEILQPPSGIRCIDSSLGGAFVFGTVS
ncbi:hypothetical protein PYCC9005_005931 [Savitreella phatthalungensis]